MTPLLVSVIIIVIIGTYFVIQRSKPKVYSSQQAPEIANKTIGEFKNYDKTTLHESILKRLDTGDSFSSRETMEFHRQPDAAARLFAAIQHGEVQRRQAGLRLLIQIGRAVIPAEGNRPEVLGPIVDNPAVLKALLEMLTDPDEDVRRQSCVTLADLVPGDLIRPHAGAILAALKRYPSTDGALILLGKTGTPDALRLLEEIPEIGQASPENVRLVQARLGEREAEAAEIRAYGATSDPRAKAEAARRLGYIGTRQTVIVLARDIRMPLTYVWLVKSERSFRLHIIEGLHLAFMHEPIFWRPYFKPSDDYYYEKIEKWLTDHLGVTWDHPRPPFLYEEDSPTPVLQQGPPAL